MDQNPIIRRASTHYFSIQYDKRSAPFNMPTHHFHSNYEIYYLLSGERNYFIDGHFYHVTQGDLVFIKKNAVHKTTTTGKHDHERVVLYFDQAALGNKQYLLDDPHSPFNLDSPILSLNVHEQKYIEDLFYEIKEESSVRSLRHEEFMEALLIHLFIFSLRCSEKKLQQNENNENLLQTKIAEVVQYINQHYHSRITLETLSKQFYISPYYLSRIFKKATGFSFVEYLTTVRIKEAQKMLRKTNMKVSDIAADVGFENISHFIKIFKKLSQCSPLQYRKMNP
ncbi:helix-turn-helix transcriptional regulator [Paenibacillus oceani]|uniref:Helix-turn-helix transcriptional regulator n=1 Tax=Paenibacillus oceani TaxID=2772510 RepID=A0A927GZJ2_9BACL|nr:AraC family transcriptional regulator [Paenibacillus oceani]MBD2861529.1 helix-turn-helix transcriptional regulator [Paenibacillus oceani]